MWCSSSSAHPNYVFVCVQISLSKLHIFVIVWKWKRSTDDIFRNSVAVLQLQQAYIAASRDSPATPQLIQERIDTKNEDKWVPKARCVLTLHRHPNQITKAKTTAVSHKNVPLNVHSSCWTTQTLVWEVQCKTNLACYFDGAANHMIHGCPVLVSCHLTKGWQQTDPCADVKGMKTISKVKGDFESVEGCLKLKYSAHYKTVKI